MAYGIWRPFGSNLNVLSVVNETARISFVPTLFRIALFKQITKSHIWNANFRYRLDFRVLVIIAVSFDPVTKSQGKVHSIRCVSWYLCIESLPLL